MFWCRDAPILDGEQVESGTFGKGAVGIFQDHCLCAFVVGVIEAGDEIEPVIVLDRRIDRGRGNTHYVRNRGMQTALHLVAIGDRSKGDGKGDKAIDRVEGHG